MGNSTSRVVGCFAPTDKANASLEFLEPLDEGLGHSFCYVRPGTIADSPAITPSISERYTLDSSVMDSETRSGSFRQEVVDGLAAAEQQPLSRSISEATFRTISGASVSANASSIRTGNLCISLAGDVPEPAAAFESSASFAAVPLQPVPGGSGSLNTFLSGPLERGFASGPLDKGAGFMSGPLDKGTFMSGPIDSGNRSNFSAPLSYGRKQAGLGHLVHRISRPMRTVLSRTFSRSSHGSGWVQKFLLHPMAQPPWSRDAKSRREGSQSGLEAGLPEPEYNVTRNLQWAHGKAGEDRVHVVLSEEQGWLFIGIYDGFSGPDAPDFLMNNLYKAIDKELEGLLWAYKDTSENGDPVPTDGDGQSVAASLDPSCGDSNEIQIENTKQDQLGSFEKQSVPAGKDSDESSLQVQSNSTSSEQKDLDIQVSSSQECEVDEIVEETAGADVGSIRNGDSNNSKIEITRRCKSGPVNHDAVLRAMSRALQTTEEAYMEIVEKELDRNPELGLMGSCVLVMLMKDQDVYVMNLGDSRVILGQDSDQYNNSNFSKGDLQYRNRSRESLVRVELDRISEESPMHNPNGHQSSNTKTKELSICGLKMRAVQLSTDHNTSILEEVLRIKVEHPDDPQAVFNDRVKGQLKVTRAFGAGFLKKPKFNNILLEMFRIDYVGTSPYISCNPAVLHHHLCANDRFLILSSDGLYQYFSNDEVVSHVSWFMENVPEGDPAQYLVAELLCRAAKKNGMDFHELLDIPQGDRRKYHDDVSVMIISLEGRIWRSSG
ncbi:hypothetical protein QOZ80_3AG0249720 [Eleusine coracana subsp. coracana]|nr:hypothetical protein QOZ80_3AG0249720 [Eleusine coracana subsp. coracana]